MLKLGELTQPLGLNGGKKWMDAVWPEMPTIYGRVLPNNFNGTGVGLDWRVTDWGNAPTNVDSVLSIAVVNADGENLPSFLGETNPVFGGYSRTEKDTRSLLGELAYGVRSTTAIAIGSSVVFQFGGSFATGPNGVGEKGQTWFYGAHARLMTSEFARDACNRCVRDGGFVLSGEWLHRRLLVDQGGTFPRAHLDDWGYTVSGVYDFPSQRLGWGDAKLSVGCRWDLADGAGSDVDPTTGVRTSREDDLDRNFRSSVSALVAWSPRSSLQVFGRFHFVFEYRFADVESRANENAFLLGLQVR